MYFLAFKKDRSNSHQHIDGKEQVKQTHFAFDLLAVFTMRQLVFLSFLSHSFLMCPLCVCVRMCVCVFRKCVFQQEVSISLLDRSYLVAFYALVIRFEMRFIFKLSQHIRIRSSANICDIYIESEDAVYRTTAV